MGMTGQRNIEKWDPGYELLKRYVSLIYRLYYRHIYIRGKENLPKNAPVIFAPNHQNALMDALAVVYAFPGQLVFLARADIFRKKLIAKVLTFLKIMPVYRIRDGYNSLQNNEQVLKKVSDVLSVKRPLVIFPEGNHGHQKKLRPLKKGICRMALQAEDRNDFNLGLYVVPVALDYENYYKFHKSLTIHFGTPISVDPYQTLYHKNSSKAYNSLKEDIASGLKEVMLHIDSQEYYEMIDVLRAVYRHRLGKKLGIPGLKHHAWLKVDRKLVHICERQIQDNPGEAEALNRKVKAFQKYLTRLNFHPWLFRRKKYPVAVLLAELPFIVLFLPLFVYGLINNALPFFLPGLVNRNVKDPQFHSSIRNGMALITFPLFYLLQLVVFSQFFEAWWLRMLYLISLPLTGYLAYQYYRLLKKWWVKWRYNLFRKLRPGQFSRVRELREEILHTVDRWMTSNERSVPGADN